MKAHAISPGLVHFRSESQSIIVMELSEYKGRAVRKSGREIYCQIDSVRSTLITKYVRLAHDFITNMGGMLINWPAFFLEGREGMPPQKRKNISPLHLKFICQICCKINGQCLNRDRMLYVILRWFEAARSY